MNPENFWNIVNKKLYTNKISLVQRKAIDSIVDCWYSFQYCDTRNLAYILATAYHETGTLMVPVREGFAKTNEEAIIAVTNLFKKGKIKVNYALPNSKGLSYYGRGKAQITWEDNYKRIGELLKKDLLNNPDLALDVNISSTILILGMYEGWFTGKKLNDYITKINTDYVGARRIINGTDKADQIAGYAVIFEEAIRSSMGISNKIDLVSSKISSTLLRLTNPLMQGELIKEIQKVLGIHDDGVFGEKTDKAVREFQKKNKINVDGIVGNTTLRKMGLIQ